MPSASLTELYQWVQLRLGQPMYLGYLMHKINGQEIDKVLILLRLPESTRPVAELEIV